MTQNNLYQDFEEFDSAQALPAGYSEKNLSNALSEQVPQKLKVFKSIMSKVEKNVNSAVFEMGISISGLKLKNTFSAGELNRSITTKASTVMAEKGASKRALNINLNFNVNKFLMLPSYEIYSVTSFLVLSSVIKNLDRESQDLAFQNYKAIEENKEQDAQIKKTSDVYKDNLESLRFDSAKYFFKEYIKRFLPSYLDKSVIDSIQNFDYVCEIVSDKMIRNLSPEQIAKLPQNVFGLYSLEHKTVKEIRRYVPDLCNLRLNKLQADATNLMKEGMTAADFDGAKALGAEQQYLALATVFAEQRGDVKKALEGGINNENQALKDFCQQYADTFMTSNNLQKSIQIVFVDHGECEYVDRGDSHEIRINLNAKVLKGGNAFELVETLSHELTHCVDSTINKIQNKTTKEGFGLAGDMDNDISDCDAPKNSEEYKLLKEVQRCCYQLSPNERHGRIGELSALKFLSMVYSDEPEMLEKLNENIDSFNAYQNKTIKTAEALPQKIASFKNRLSGVSKNSKAYSMIQERIRYLEEIGTNLDVEAEKNSISQALSIEEEAAIQRQQNKLNKEGSQRDDSGPSM